MVYTALKSNRRMDAQRMQDSRNIVTAMYPGTIRRPGVAAIDMENLG
ncbi:MAG: hypothetical protein HYU73_06265 [Betaproteobacteria bacterium]|nr:hypothetical protein [Betaproteobacteria bacterium]